MRRHLTLAFALVSLFVAGLVSTVARPLAAQNARRSPPVTIVSADASRRARALLAQMTLEEKIGQLNLAAGFNLPGTVPGASEDNNWVAEHASAILEAWLPGVEGGNAIADVLFGDVNPGGKLPVSWPRSAGQEPLYYNHNLTQSPESDPKFTSRYWDISSKPLYSFGHGLSYTTFRVANLHLAKSQMRAGDSVQVTVDVTNTGSVPGDAVAQLYVHQRSGSASRPVRQLEGFRRVTLQPGETTTIRFTLGRAELQFWSPQSKRWVVEPSVFDVWVGEDSAAELHAELTVAP